MKCKGEQHSCYITCTHFNLWTPINLAACPSRSKILDMPKDLMSETIWIHYVIHTNLQSNLLYIYFILDILLIKKSQLKLHMPSLSVRFPVIISILQEF